MKIILAHKFFKYTGGAEVFFLETGRVLKENGHEVAYFSTTAQDNIDSEYSNYFVTPPDYNNGGLIKRTLAIGNIIYSNKAKENFAALIRDFKPDIIHAFAIHVHLTPSILEAAKEAGVPVVMSCNDYKHICPNYKIFDGTHICEACKGGRFYNAVFKKCCKDSLVFSTASAIEAYVHERKKVYDKLVDRYLFASEFMLNKTKEFWAKKTIDYGVMKNPFNASQYHPVYQGDYALYFGRIISEKGVDRIIEAAKKTSIPIKIIGDGPDLHRLQQEVSKHGLSHVDFLGAMWGEELNQILYGARFVIVPSLWHENFPYVIFQAFSAGKPVIGSQRGGIPELVSEERGLLFDPDNVKELVACMDQLWNDTDQCKRMGQLARQYVETEFSDDVFYDSIMSNYKAVIS
ncbi:MAG: glycosyltransferase [Methylococcales bacterium]